MESGVEVHAASRPRPDISPLGPTYRALSLGIFAIVVVIAFEFMAVATALPVAARELGGLSFYAWALTGFLGAAMFANGVAGGVCDRIGPRPPLVTSALVVPAWLAGVGLVVGGLGMGLSMSSNSVLLFDLSPPDEQGANSAALQMSDSLGGLIVIGAGGVIYALWRHSWPALTRGRGVPCGHSMAAVTRGSVRCSIWVARVIIVADRSMPGKLTTVSSTRCRSEFDRATTRHHRSPGPVTVCASMTSGISARCSPTGSCPRAWLISRVTNAVTGKPMASGSSSGPHPRTTPARSIRSSRAWTVPRATRRRREASSTPILGSAANRWRIAESNASTAMASPSRRTPSRCQVNLVRLCRMAPLVDVPFDTLTSDEAESCTLCRVRTMMP